MADRKETLSTGKKAKQNDPDPERNSKSASEEEAGEKNEAKRGTETVRHPRAAKGL